MNRRPFQLVRVHTRETPRWSVWRWFFVWMALIGALDVAIALTTRLVGVFR